MRRKPPLRPKISDLTARTKEASIPVVKNLRLPKEHSTDKAPWFIIIKGGEVFSKELLTSEGPTRNTDIFNIETSGDDETWNPISGKGIPGTNITAISQLLAEVAKSNRYVTFIVYDDSFHAFILARDNAISQGIEYGWVPEEQSDTVTFSTTGSVPQPQ